MREDGLIYADNGKPFSIVHQYDRYQPWKEHILGKEKEATLVTALYDIGRDSWEGFQRSHDYYKNLMRGVLSLDNPIVIYVDEKDVEFVNDHRKGKENKTKVIPTKFEDFYVNKTWGNRIKEVMSSEQFLKDQTVPSHPQIKYPEYNILMHEKIQFVKRAIEENHFNTDHYMWIDAGIFHMNNRVDLLGKKFPTPKHFDDKIHFIAIEDAEDEILNNVEKFYKGHNVKIIGTSWMGNKNAILSFASEYENLIKESLEKNMFDQDQSFLTITYLRNKSICKLHKGSWQDSLNLW
jgi:protein YibB